MDIKKLTNKNLINISKLSTAEMDKKIKKGYLDMLADRTVSAKEVFENIRKNYGLEDFHA